MRDPRHHCRGDVRVVLRHFDRNLNTHVLQPDDIPYLMAYEAQEEDISPHTLLWTPHGINQLLTDHSGETSDYLKEFHRTASNVIKLRTTPIQARQPANVFISDRPDLADVPRDEQKKRQQHHPEDVIENLVRLILEVAYDGTLDKVPDTFAELINWTDEWRLGWLKDEGVIHTFKRPAVWANSKKPKQIQMAFHRPTVLRGIPRRKIDQMLEAAYQKQLPAAEQAIHDRVNAPTVTLPNGDTMTWAPPRSPRTVRFVGDGARVAAAQKRYDEFLAEYRRCQRIFMNTPNKSITFPQGTVRYRKLGANCYPP